MNKEVYKQAVMDYLELKRRLERMPNKEYQYVKTFFKQEGYGRDLTILFRIDFKSISVYLTNNNGYAQLKDTFLTRVGDQYYFGLSVEGYYQVN